MARSRQSGTLTRLGLSAAVYSQREVRTVTISGMSINLSFCARKPCESNDSRAADRLRRSTRNRNNKTTATISGSNNDLVKQTASC